VVIANRLEILNEKFINDVLASKKKIGRMDDGVSRECWIRSVHVLCANLCAIAAKEIFLNSRSTIYVTWYILCGANSVHPREIPAVASDARSERGFSRTE
jgi:hypothetical protein